jgi:hypothetical protein
MKRIILVAGMIFLGTTGFVFGQTKTTTISTRQANQQARIEQGVKSKELTKPEAARLEREQKDIRIEKRMAKADGKVTPRERKILVQDQNKASKDIYKQKHDAQIR